MDQKTIEILLRGQKENKNISWWWWHRWVKVEDTEKQPTLDNNQEEENG